MLRRITEIALGRIWVRRRLPRKVGGGYVVASARMAGLRYLFRQAQNLDPALFRVAYAIVNPGDVVWDIGANVGLFAATAAGIAGSKGEVYAFEADRDTYSFLLRTAGSQPGSHAAIRSLNTALAAECGVVKFHIANRSRSANFLAGYGSSQTGGVLETRLIPSLTLDALLPLLPSPQVLKIDVEGAEMLVLQGAKNILTHVRPVIFIEVSEHTALPVANLLHQHNYCLFDGATFRRIRRDQAACWDTVAYPEETAPSELVNSYDAV